MQPPPAQAFEVTTGWYPGKLLGQFTARLFGATTTVVGYPAQPMARAPVFQTASRPVMMTSGYQPSACCNPCGTSFTAGSPVMSSGCSTCGVSQIAPAATYVPAPVSVPSPAPAGSTFDPRPTLAPDYPVNGQSGANRPVLEADPPQSGELSGDSPAGGASYFEAPRLYDPRDGRAQQTSASLWTAQYEHPAAAHATVTKQAVHLTSARPVYDTPQSEYNTAGWTSARD